VRVSLQLDVQHNALVVPASAVQSGQAGDVVWTVDSAQKAHVNKVKVLRSTDSLAVLAGGLAAGAQVITDGQLRLTEGARVAIRTAGQRSGRDSTANSTGRGRGDSGTARQAGPP
jgi:multidrug efflux system membrane fusion protein